MIRFSSNIGIARFTERLSRRELFEILRDFGFGAPTGVTYPSEASGVLKEPRSWSCPSQARIAIGYEISVTAVQLAAAYGAIANDGLLLVPTLVKSIRDADDELVYEHQPQVVRRVLKPKTARMLREVLASVVDSGTATDAEPGDVRPWRKERHRTARWQTGGMCEGSYTSTFVGLFPARDPQYVVLVKLDNPRAATTAARSPRRSPRRCCRPRSPRATRRSTAATWRRSALVMCRPPMSRAASPGRRERRVGADSRVPPPRYALVDSTPVAPPARVRFDLRADTAQSRRRGEQVTVPDVRGMPVRVAARELHRAGLRVSFVERRGVRGLAAPGHAGERGHAGEGGAAVTLVISARAIEDALSRSGELRSSGRMPESVHGHHGRQPSRDKGLALRRGAWQHARWTRLPGGGARPRAPRGRSSRIRRRSSLPAFVV